MYRIVLILWIVHFIWSCAVEGGKVQPRRRQQNDVIRRGSLLRSGSMPSHCGRSRHRTPDPRSPSLTDEGYRIQSLVKRVVGGHQSASGEWPWLVTLQLKRNRTRFVHTCGGTLIHPRWIVTAAHCFEKIWATHMTDDPTAWKARLGEHNMFSDEDEHQTDVDIEKIIIYPSRNPPKTFNFDVALLKLSRAVKLSDNINIACLPSVDDRVPVGTVCVTAGWGYSVEDGEISTVVQHVQIPIISSKTCNSLYQKISQYVRIRISHDMMCAGDSGKDACQFDSGGPMVYYNEAEDQWILVGIVSTGFGCARPGFPGIYTKVSEFVPWIQEVISKED